MKVPIFYSSHFLFYLLTSCDFFRFSSPLLYELYFIIFCPSVQYLQTLDLGSDNFILDSSHRVSIERKSPYKESYTVNSHRKSFDYVLSDVRACVRFQN